MGSEGGGGGELIVKVNKREVVAAVLPLQEHWLPLSNLDLLLPPVDVGQVVSNPVGEPEILCNNRGVDFVEAFAEAELKDLDFYNPDDTVEGKLVPKKKHGVLAVQATELRCGGLVVACTFDHRIADAYSANLFLVSWAEMAQSKPISTAPCFRRSLLNPRRPGSIHPSLNDMYVPVTSLPPPKDPHPGDDYLISRIYYIKADQLNQLQSLATTTNGCRRTKLESFSAFLWKMVAKHAVLNNVDKKVTKMGIVVDGRTRLSDGDRDKASLMGSYFGNVLSIPYGGKEVNEIDENPLSYVANEVHEFLDGAVTKEHFLGLIDWVESHRPVPGLAKIYCSGSEDGPAFVVSSGQRFPDSKVDFGWGKPLFGSYHFPWGGDSGYVMPMPSPSCNGDWVVYVHLLKGQVELIETEAAHLFRPLTFDYLQDTSKE
nr:shikimate o-hydroxycinnamoyltransferase [Quercus suber]